MKLRIYSDIHNEFHRDKRWEPPVLQDELDTVLIFAGDIDYLKHSIRLANDMSTRFKAVILVPGNHEYYGSDRLGDERKRETEANVYVLNNSTVTIDDVLFVGSTFWTALPTTPGVRSTIEYSMNDFNYIRWDQRCGYRKFQIKDWISQHHLASTYLQQIIHNVPSNKRVVCVTHHAPSWKSSGDRKLEMIDHAYYSDYDDLVDKVDLWVHGHTHHNVDYTIGNGRVVSNCRGYHRLIGGDTLIPAESSMPKFDESGLQIGI